MAVIVVAVVGGDVVESVVFIVVIIVSVGFFVDYVPVVGDVVVVDLYFQLCLIVGGEGGAK